MEKMYHELKKRMNKINFDAIWPEFKQYNFALFDGKNVYSNNGNKKWDSRYFGCTAIKMDDKLIAIWDVRMIPNGYDLNFLCANIIHEMFHCFHIEKHEQKFPNELMGMSYPITIENQVLKYMETQCLYQAFIEENHLSKKEKINQFLNYRLKREEILGQYIHYEYQLESVEGLAMYVEMKALSQLTNFEDSFHHYCKGINKINSNLLKTRQSSFVPGMLIGLLLDELYDSWKMDFMLQEKYSFEILKDLVEIKPINLDIDKHIKKEIEDLIDKRNQEINKVFDSILKKEHKKLVGGFSLTGFDPMNLYKKENMIYHKNMIKFNKNGKETYIEGPVVSLHDPKNIFMIYEIHYIHK